MTLPKFDPWISFSVPRGRAYRAYRAYPAAVLGTIGTIGTGASPGYVHKSAEQRREGWLRRLGDCCPRSKAEKRLVATALRLAITPWSDGLIQLAWSDHEIFAADGGLAQTLLPSGTRLRAVTDASAWVERPDGTTHRHCRHLVVPDAELIWDMMSETEMNDGN